MSVLTWPDEGISVLGMSTTAATQESKVTQNSITPSEIREGDRIRVTTQDGDRTNSFTGVANHYKVDRFDGKRRWFTADDWTLWTDDDSAVIKLLDRPEPKVPNKSLAIVHYTYTPYEGATPDARTAVRDADGRWNAYDSDGYSTNSFHSDESFAEYLGSDYANELVVAFGGTK